MKVTYNPGPGDPEVTEAFGRVFAAGEAVEIPDDAPYAAKLKRNPFFQVAGEKKPPGSGPDTAAEDTDLLRERLTASSTELVEARAEIARLQSELATKERDFAAAQSLLTTRTASTLPTAGSPGTGIESPEAAAAVAAGGESADAPPKRGPGRPKSS